MPTDPRVETLRLLQSIDSTLKALLLVMSEGRNAPAAEVNDAALNGPYGDPIVKAKDPRDWSGDQMTGRNFSQCPPAYLDLLADRFDYFAGKEPDEKKAGYNRLDAKRARGWAARLRSGWTAPEPAAATSGEW